MTDPSTASTTAVHERPTPEGYMSWPDYWKAQGMPWRTEPEIDEDRQQYLAELRVIVPDIKKDIYPFKDIRLDRADVEWLLATHENGGMRGPVDWDDEAQRGRTGLDMRGADLRGASLRGLPLACTVAGLNAGERIGKTPQQRAMAGVQAEGVDLSLAHLERARFSWANLAETSLYAAFCQDAQFNFARLEGANLRDANLAGATLRNASFDVKSYLKGVILVLLR